MENYKAIANLIIKYRKSTLNDEEQRQLNEWLEQSEENNELFKRLIDESYLAKLNAIDLKAKREKIFRFSVKSTTSIKRMNQLSIAAIFFVLVSGVFVWLSFFKEKSTLVADSASLNRRKKEIKAPPPLDAYTPGKSIAVLSFADGFKIGLDTAQDGPIASVGNVEVIKLKDGQIIFTHNAERTANAINAHNSLVTVHTPRGGQYRLTLSDGSKVWLNASSELRFPAIFNEDERNVTLSGEAYFEVSEQKSPVQQTYKSFIVDVNAVAKVYVIGTTFNIMSYKEEKVMKTTLLQGTVKITSKNREQEVIISGRQARIDKAGNISILKKVDVGEETAWKEKGVKLSNATLEQVIHQISRLYDIDILMDKNTADVNDLKVDIEGNTPLPDVLDMVQDISHTSYKYEEGKIKFTK